MTIGTRKRNKKVESSYGTAVKDCPRCARVMPLDFDYKSGYYRCCLNCSSVEYLDNSALKYGNGKK
jgi:hypothetical protein